MPFTAQEVANITAAALDFHMDQGKVDSQTIQDKPLLAAMREKEKSFPSGKDSITIRVKGEYTTTNQGFEHDDTVDYANPANIKTGNYPWKLLHAGISFSMHELAKDGISVVDSETGSQTTEHTGREKTALANLLEDKLEDMQEGSDRDSELMYWRDGTSDPKKIPGVRSFILDNPAAAGLVGGLDPIVNTWWRNRARTASSADGAINAGTPANQVLVQTLQKEMRQLRRYGSPQHKVFAGSDFMDAFEQELRSKGNYTLDGWSKGGNGVIDASVADLAFKGLRIQYCPTLDDEGLAKYSYWLDMKSIVPMYMEGENWKKHAPARPYDKYVFYRAKTYIGGLVCKRRNTSGVYAIA